MKWPEVEHRTEGYRMPFNVLTKDQLRAYLALGNGWHPSHGGKPGSSLEVRRMIAAKLLAGEI